MRPTVKGEIPDAGGQAELGRAAAAPSDQAGVIELSSSESDDSEVEDEDEGEGEGERGRAKRSRVSSEGRAVKRQKKALEAALPLGFLDPLPPEEPIAVAAPAGPVVRTGCKQFWKAGDFDGSDGADSLALPAVGMDHVRVHPKFLHSNATSHKWALGALAELLDNSLDEVCNGATFVNIDMLENRKNGTRMLLVEDNGGGMDPDKMRQCMSLGYSTKCKIANTIGQYGNGFKTSTMRLGADVIVFSRSHGREGRSPTQSIGMLSYTFLRNTGKEDIVVPMLDYEKKGQVWSKLMRTSSVDWKTNVETIVQWSPYSSEQDLLQQFNSMPDQGTRIVIYNLWEDDQGELELDFDTDKHDIQVRGVNRDEKKIQMAKQFPNSRHFLTYRHSLRSYASILYLRLPRAFKMILRGKEIEHHNIVNDMMLKQEVTYRPQPGADGVPKDPNMVAVVTIGFVKDAKGHIDVQGFNVYYKNRLIKPFWRVWNAAGSDGRGVLGVLEANFVEPAHDKQDFERTIVLSRLEIRLIQMQKTYWTTHCHRIGYAPRRNKKLIESEDRESSREAPSPSSRHSSPFVGMSPNPAKYQFSDKSVSGSSKTGKPSTTSFVSAKTGNYKSSHSPASRDSGKKGSEKLDEDYRPSRSKLHGTSVANNESDSEIEYFRSKRSVNDLNGAKSSCAQRSLLNEITHPSLSTPPKSTYNRAGENHASNGAVGVDRISTRSQSKAVSATCNGNEPTVEDSELRIKQLKEENEALKERISKIEKSMLHDLQYERERNKSLTEQLRAAEKKLEESRKEQEALIDIFSEERSRRDRDEDSLRKKLKDSSATIQELLEKLGTVQSNRKP